MKHLAPLVSLLAIALMVPGCPIYGDEGCFQDSDCPDSYLCDNVTGLCSPSVTVVCSGPAQCSVSETCGMDGLCHAGDCSWQGIGCIAGYECSGESGSFRCVRSDGSTGGAGGDSGLGGAPATGGGAPDATAGVGGSI
jgi:hypothetical protein